MKLFNLVNKFSKSIFAVFLISIVFIACEKEDTGVQPPAPPNPRPNVVFYGLSDNNQLIRYNATTAETPEATIAITGLGAGETILSIDFRPATGQLYGVGSSSRLYAINLTSGAATALGAAAFTPAISGSIVNIDFNPTVDRIRLVTNTGQNLRLHPETGAVAFTDGNINGGSNPAITSIAYTNNFAGSSATDLFVIDGTTRKLYKQNPPNNGTLEEVGTINVNFTGQGGFDLVDTFALATFTVDGVRKLYNINTTNGTALFLVNIAANIKDIAIPTAPVAYAIGETGSFQIFDPTKANSFTNKTITGLGAGETLMGIDFRPVNGQLYGLGVGAGTAKLYNFNLSTGAATAVGTGFAIGAGTTAVGFDFNPVVDRIRVVTNTGQNLRLNPIDGTIAATDGSLNPGTPSVSAAAYSNNFAGTTTTTLFVMDMTKIYRQEPPNNGTLVDVGNLGVTIDALNGFDIGGRSNNGFAVLTVGGITKVYTVNTTNGTVTAGVDFPNKVRGFSIGLGF